MPQNLKRFFTIFFWYGVRSQLIYTQKLCNRSYFKTKGQKDRFCNYYLKKPRSCNNCHLFDYFSLHYFACLVAAKHHRSAIFIYLAKLQYLFIFSVNFLLMESWHNWCHIILRKLLVEHSALGKKKNYLFHGATRSGKYRIFFPGKLFSFSKSEWFGNWNSHDILWETSSMLPSLEKNLPPAPTVISPQALIMS